MEKFKFKPMTFKLQWSFSWNSWRFYRHEFHELTKSNSSELVRELKASWLTRASDCARSLRL